MSMAELSQCAGNSYQGTVASGNSRVQYGNTYNVLQDRPETPPLPLSTVPFLRDPDYICREQLVTEIRHKLLVPGTRVALVGLGGIGKSQLAIEYAHQIRQDSPETWVLWLHASNVTRFELSVRDTLQQLKVPGGNDPKANVFQLLRTWLRNNNERKWLLILDNADDVRFLLEPPPTIGQTESQSQRPGERCLDYLPECSHGSLLVTTRSSDAALNMVEHRNIVSVDLMDEEHALSLLDKKLGGGYDQDEIVELARELDRMPLAMAQAAAYIKQRSPRCSVQSYVEKLKKSSISKSSLLGHDGVDLRRDRDAKNSILSTWQISFEHIRSIRRSAADLLSLMSCFDRQAIPEALLRTRSTELDGHATSSAKSGPQIIDDKTNTDEYDHDSKSNNSSDDEVDVTSAIESEDFEDDLMMLQGYSFIAVTSDTATFEMHGLVQLATQRWLKETQRLTHWQSRFVHNLENEFPVGTFENWAKCRTLFPHAMIVLGLTLTDRDTVLRQGSLLYNSGWYAWEQGNYVYAEKMEALCVELRRKVLGLEHLETLRSMSSLALTLHSQGQYEQATKLRNQVLDIQTRVLGPEHPDTLTSISNLALTLGSQGRYDKAAELGKQVLDNLTRVLGPEHPHTLTSISILAVTFRSQGLYDKAAELGKQVLDNRTRVLGPEHPATLNSVSNLTSMFHSLGQYEKAAELAKQVLEIRTKVLGPEHLDTLNSMGNLAAILQSQRQDYEAAELGRQVLEICKRVLGPEHPDTLIKMSNLAWALQSQGQYQQAADLGGQVLEIRKRVLGPEHPDTLTSMTIQAFNLKGLNCIQQAIEHMRQSSCLSSVILGNTHPEALYRNQLLSQWSDEHAKTTEAGHVDTAGVEGTTVTAEDDEDIDDDDGGVHISES
ncbi:hypothetical protein Q7P37_001002 [Cladosporium fusiforme]